MGIKEAPERGQPVAHPVGSDLVSDGLENFQGKPTPIFEVSTILIVPDVHPVAHELIQKVTVRPVDFDAIEPHIDCVSSRLTKLLHDLRQLGGLQRARGFKVDHRVGLDRIRLAFDGNRTRRDRKSAIRLVVSMTRTTAVPDLEEEDAAFLLDGFRDGLPSLALLRCIDARRARISMPLARDERPLCDNQATWCRSLGIVFLCGLAGHVTEGATPRQRSHDHAMVELKAPDIHGVEYRRHGTYNRPVGLTEIDRD